MTSIEDLESRIAELKAQNQGLVDNINTITAQRNNAERENLRLSSALDAVTFERGAWRTGALLMLAIDFVFAVIILR